MFCSDHCCQMGEESIVPVDAMGGTYMEDDPSMNDVCATYLDEHIDDAVEGCARRPHVSTKSPSTSSPSTDVSGTLPPSATKCPTRGHARSTAYAMLGSADDLSASSDNDSDDGGARFIMQVQPLPPDRMRPPMPPLDMGKVASREDLRCLVKL